MSPPMSSTGAPPWTCVGLERPGVVTVTVMVVVVVVTMVGVTVHHTESDLTS